MPDKDDKPVSMLKRWAEERTWDEVQGPYDGVFLILKPNGNVLKVKEGDEHYDELVKWRAEKDEIAEGGKKWSQEVRDYAAKRKKGE